MRRPRCPEFPRRLGRWLGVLRLALGVAAAAQSNDPLYHLRPGDLVRVALTGEPELAAERRIDDQGAVILPLIGTIKLGNLTVVQAADKIGERYLSGQFLVHPQVTVTYADDPSNDVSVIGEVNHPGQVTFPAQANTLPIVDVIRRAGGFTRSARTDAVRITRISGEGKPAAFTVDVGAILSGRMPPFLALPGDVIFIPETHF